MRKNLTWILIAVAIFVLDRATKLLVIHHLPFQQPVAVLPFFNLFFTYNTGAAFSFLQQASGWQEWLFSAIAILISVVIIIWQIKLPAQKTWLRITLALILGGALGNFYDRLSYHYVIDFLDFHISYWHWPAFNIADSAICVGAIMLIVNIMLKNSSKNPA